MQAVASGDHVELLDDGLHLKATLLFSDAFPSSASRNASIHIVAADTGSRRVGYIFYL